MCNLNSYTIRWLDCFMIRGMNRNRKNHIDKEVSNYNKFHVVRVLLVYYMS